MLRKTVIFGLFLGVLSLAQDAEWYRERLEWKYSGYLCDEERTFYALLVDSIPAKAFMKGSKLYLQLPFEPNTWEFIERHTRDWDDRWKVEQINSGKTAWPMPVKSVTVWLEHKDSRGNSITTKQVLSTGISAISFDKQSKTLSVPIAAPAQKYVSINATVLFADRRCIGWMKYYAANLPRR